MPGPSPAFDEWRTTLTSIRSAGRNSMKNRSIFNTIARKAAHAAGTPWVFCTAVGAVILWACSGPLFGFNDTWQLVINTSTTIVTVLMVFLIQHTQNADTTALHLKLDELIRVTREADDELLNMEELDEMELEALRRRYEDLADRAARHKADVASRSGASVSGKGD
jgi:low affinity Fe/Cu permease